MTGRGFTRVASRGLLWTYGSITLTLVLQVGYTALTARSLGPSVFGAYAASQALAMLLSYLSLSTVGNAVARMTRVEAPLLATAWSLAAGGGLVAALLAVVIAPWWWRLWNVHEHLELVVLAAPTVLLVPASNLAVALLRQRLDYGSAALTELLAAVVGMGGIGIAIAATRDAWLLTMAMPVSLLLSWAGACVVAGVRPRFGWCPRGARELAAFLGPVSGQYLTHYLVTTWPQLLFGRLFGPEALGYLSRCNMLVMTPSAHIAAGLSKVLFPLLARVRDDPGGHRRATTSLLVLTTGVAAYAFGTVTGAAEPLVRLVLGEQWRGAASLVPVLGAGAAVNLVLVLTSNVLESAMRTRSIWLAQGTMLAAAAVLSAGLLAAGAASAQSVLWIFTGAQCAGHAAQLGCLARRQMVDLGAALSAYTVHVVIGLTLFSALTVGARATAGESAVFSCAAEVVVASVVTGLMWAVRRRVPAWTVASSLGLRPRHRIAGG